MMTEAGYEKGTVWALGLMSGTSMDGVDAALIETDGVRLTQAGPTYSLRYPDTFRDQLRGLLGQNIDPEKPQNSQITRIVDELTDFHGEAVKRLLNKADINSKDVHVIGFHGQTIFHDPSNGITRQIGDASRLAAMTGIDVAFDFRSADVAAGGQGAPLACAYHRALADALPKPLAVLNLGGVGNVTWLGDGNEMLAFDTGPANALLDDWMVQQTGCAFDEDGGAASRGTPDFALVEKWMSHQYFRQRAPKSLDRDAFKHCWPDGMATEDGAATLAAFTCRAVQSALTLLPIAPSRWIVTGGGRRNPVLMSGLRAVLKVNVDTVEAVGWDGDHLEAQAFAYLGVRSRAGLPLSYPGTTGVPEPITGGKLTRVPGIQA